MRQCSKPGCSRNAVATLTYDYHDSTAVLGPLATTAQPHAYDLCDTHAESMTVPRGWQVMRLQTRFEPAPPSSDDLLALVEVIRDVAGAKENEGEGGQPHARPPRPLSSQAAEDPAARYAPLRQSGRFTVISGDQEE